MYKQCCGFYYCSKGAIRYPREVCVLGTPSSSVCVCVCVFLDRSIAGDLTLLSYKCRTIQLHICTETSQKPDIGEQAYVYHRNEAKTERLTDIS